MQLLGIVLSVFGVLLEHLPVLKIVVGECGRLDDQAVIALGAEAVVGPVGGTEEDCLWLTVFHVDNELVVTDLAGIEHAVIFIGVGSLQTKAVFVVGIIEGRSGRRWRSRLPLFRGSALEIGEDNVKAGGKFL